MNCDETIASPTFGAKWNGRKAGLLLALLVVVVAAFLAELAFGPVQVPLREVFRALMGEETSQSAWKPIVLLTRLPRALAAVLAGAALGVGGLLTQTLFRNPIADPFVLGISAAAGLGVALLILGAEILGLAAWVSFAGMSGLSLAGAAGLGAGGAFLLVMLVARRVRGNTTLLVLGLLFGYVAGSAISVLTQFSSAEATHRYLRWSFGSFGGVTAENLPPLALCVFVGLAVSFIFCKTLNALSLGEEYARSMGARVGRSRAAIIAAISLLAGAVTAYCGPIAFIGIAAPHICRLLFRDADHRVLAPGAALTGAALATLADLGARAPGLGVELPLNAVTSLLGAPLVIFLIMKNRGGLEDA